MVEIPKQAAIFLFLFLTMRVHGQSSTTVAPTTVAATTVAATTVAATTVAATTVAATTVAATTVAATTVAATTVAATTVASASTTAAPTTVASTGNVSITSVPTTASPTTVANANCTDSPTCSGLSSVACRFPSLVSACPLLCHRNSSCAITEGTTIRTSFRLTNEVYNNNLANPSSTEFSTLKTKVQNMIGAALTQELGNRFVSIVVNGFSSGSVIVDADITLTDENNNDAFEIVSKAIVASGVSGLDSSSVKVGVCSDGYVSVNNQCLMFGSQRLTWNASVSACERLSGRLVVPTDFQKMANFILTNKLFYWQYWVGASATNQSDPSTYKWLDGTTVDSSLWYSGYPLTPGTSPGVTLGQSCVKLHPNSNTNNGLIASWDSNCNGTHTYRYICEEL